MDTTPAPSVDSTRREPATRLAPPCSITRNTPPALFNERRSPASPRATALPASSTSRHAAVAVITGLAIWPRETRAMRPSAVRGVGGTAALGGEERVQA